MTPDEFISQHHDDVRRLALSLLRKHRGWLDADEVDDILQACVVRAWIEFGNYDDTRGVSPMGWAYRCIQWEVMNYMTRRHRRRQRIERYEQHNRASHDPTAQIHAKLDVERVMPRQHFKTFVRWWDGETCTETAAALGLHRSTIKLRLHASRTWLRRMLGA